MVKFDKQMFCRFSIIVQEFEMDISRELVRIASEIGGDEVEWKIENIDIWGSKDWGEFKSDRFDGKREIGSKCIEYLVGKYPDWRGKIRVKWFGNDIFHVMDKSGESLLEVKRVENEPFHRFAKMDYEDVLEFDKNGECHDRKSIASAWGKVVMPENSDETVVKDGDLYLYCVALTQNLTDHFWAVYPGVENEKEVRTGYSAKLPHHLVKRLP